MLIKQYLYDTEQQNLENRLFRTVENGSCKHSSPKLKISLGNFAQEKLDE